MELHYNSAKEVWIEPLDTVATTATVALYKADGTTAGVSLSATIPSASTTVAAGSSSLALVVASAVGFSVGERVRVSSQGVAQCPRVVRIDGTTLRLAASLEHVPDTGSAVEAVRITSSIPALGETLLGTDYRLEWI